MVNAGYHLKHTTRFHRGLLVILVTLFTHLFIKSAPKGIPIIDLISVEEKNILEDLTTIHEGELFLFPEMLSGKNDTRSLRPYLIRQLISQGFSDFVIHPYATGNNVVTSRAMGSGYEVLEPILEEDNLDKRLAHLGTGWLEKEVTAIAESTRSTRSGLYLFKNTTDLRTIGYEVVSHRQRISDDREYRRFNISQSFKLMGNVVVILPGEQVQFLDAAQFDGYEQQNYVEGYAIIEGEEEKDYGGGICGASTAIYQGILTNKGLQVTQRRQHSKRFSNLYTATINHEEIRTPGIDSAIYQGVIDLRIKNHTPSPIILIMNYDGSYEGVEEVFTLSMPHTQGSFEFISGGYARADKEVDDPEGTGKIIEQVKRGCYTWLINGENTTSCYQEIR